MSCHCTGGDENVAFHGVSIDYEGDGSCEVNSHTPIGPSQIDSVGWKIRSVWHMVCWGLDLLAGNTQFDGVLATSSQFGDPELSAHCGHKLVVTNVHVGMMCFVKQELCEVGFRGQKDGIFLLIWQC